MPEGRQFVVEILDAQSGAVETISVSGLRVVGSRITGTAAGGAYSLSTYAGNGQSAIVAAAVTPPSVRVTDANGLPVAGSTVTFVLGAGDSATASSMTHTTNSNGVATVGAWSMGTTAGQANVLQAFSTNLANSPLGFTITPTAASAFSAAVSAGNSQGTTPTGTYPSRVTILVHDQYGNPAPSATVTWSSSDANGSFSADTGATNASGLLGVVYTAGQSASTQSIYGAISSATSARFGLGIVAGRAAEVQITSGDFQTALSDTTLPIAISGLIDDGFGNAISSGETVNFVVVAGSGNVSRATQTPVASAWSVEWMTGSGTGQNKLEISLVGVSNSTVTATCSATNPEADTIAIESGNSQSGTVNAALSLPLAVLATAGGNAAEGQLIAFGATAGSLSTSLVVSGATGIARTVWTLPTTASVQTVTVSAGTLTGSPLYFVATGVADSASSLTFSVRPSSQPQAGVAFVQQPVIVSTDVYGNLVSTDTRVQAVLVSGTGPLSSGVSTFAVGSGVTATFSGLSVGATGDHVIGFQCNSLSTCTALVTADPPFASQMAFTTQPSNVVATSAIVPAIVVAIQDSLGNTVTTATNAVTVALTTPGSAILSGTVTVNAVGGLATFTGLSVDVAGTYTLTATASGLPDVVSTSFTVSAASGAHPNEPAGMTQETNQPWTVEPGYPAYDAYGWRTDAGSGNVSIVANATAPVSPTSVLKIIFPTGLKGGQAPCSVLNPITGTTAKQLYVHMHLYIDPNWTNNGNVGTKWFWIRQDSGNANHYVNFINGTTGAGACFGLGLQFNQQSTSNREISTSFSASASNKGRWLDVEFYMKMNTSLSMTQGPSGNADGIYKCWVDGVLRANQTNVLYATQASDWYFNYGVRINPTYGGGSNSPPSGNIYMLIDNTYVSRGA